MSPLMSDVTFNVTKAFTKHPTTNPIFLPIPNLLLTRGFQERVMTHLYAGGLWNKSLMSPLMSDVTFNVTRAFTKHLTTNPIFLPIPNLLLTRGFQERVMTHLYAGGLWNKSLMSPLMSDVTFNVTKAFTKHPTTNPIFLPIPNLLLTRGFQERVMTHLYAGGLWNKSLMSPLMSDVTFNVTRAFTKHPTTNPIFLPIPNLLLTRGFQERVMTHLYAGGLWNKSLMSPLMSDVTFNATRAFTKNPIPNPIFLPHPKPFTYQRFPGESYDTFVCWRVMKQVFDEPIDVWCHLQCHDLELVLKHTKTCIITHSGIVKPKFSHVEICMCRAFLYVKLSQVKCFCPDYATHFTPFIQQFIV